MKLCASVASKDSYQTMTDKNHELQAECNEETKQKRLEKKKELL